MKLSIWFFETRPQFLILSGVLVFLGTAMAWYDGVFRFSYFLLTCVGLLLLHISVNTLNDYFDYKSGIDLETKRTPFSGGSGVLPAKLLNPPDVLKFGIACFILAIPIGGYFFLVRGWLLLPLFLLGSLFVLFYTSHITRLWWPELAAGLGMGALPVLGIYIIQSGVYTASAIFAAVPSGILVHNLLLLNEIPDITADKRAGRRTIPIITGEKNAIVIYSTLTLFMYVHIASGVVAKLMPPFTLLALLTLPIAIKAIIGAIHYTEEEKLLSAMGSNVIVVMITQILIGVGYVLAKLL